MERAKEPKLFDFQRYGMTEPSIEKVPFSKKFSHLKDHRKTEAAYHPGEKKTYLNSEMPSAEHDIAENHERVHHFQRELGSKHPEKYSQFISTVASLLHPDDIKKLGVYAQSGHNSSMSRDEMYSELLPHIYSMAKSPWHRENFKQQFGGTDQDLDRFSHAWDTVSGSLGLSSVNKAETKEPSLAAQIKQAKIKNLPPKPPTFDEQVKAIKAKYHDKKIEKIGTVANAGPAGFTMSEKPEVQKSVHPLVAAGLQPSKEQWEAELARQLGIPADRETAEQLAKQAEKEWENSVANSFKVLHQPVEKTAKDDWGSRGRVDQSDESQLTEEEKRIRAISVNPDLLKD